jgi:hypothetical protein
MSLSSQQIMQIALELAGLKQVPADSGIHVTEDKVVDKVLAGVDIGPAELLLAKHLECDLALAHHPTGGPTSINFYQVISNQINQMTSVGVPEEEAKEAIAELQASRKHQAHGSNYDRNPSFARTLGMPYMNVHLPCDIIGRDILANAAKSRLVDGNGTISDVLDGIASLPEYQDDISQPVCMLGSPDNSAGRIFTATAGGTNGGAAVAKTYFKYCIDTLIYFHIAWDQLKKLREDPSLEGKNLIVLGHMPADRVGINPLLSEIEKNGVEVIRISGL